MSVGLTMTYIVPPECSGCKQPSVFKLDFEKDGHRHYGQHVCAECLERNLLRIKEQLSYYKAIEPMYDRVFGKSDK